MATKKDLTKEEKIKREFSRLKRIFKDLDKNKLQTVESLTTNPFLILFDDLDGVTSTGIWNESLQRIEC